MLRTAPYNHGMSLQVDLFNSPSRKSEPLAIELPGAEVCLYSAWLGEDEANAALHTLAEELPWDQPEIIIAGQQHRIPRMQVWCGDPGAVMRYSGKLFHPQTWHPLILQIKSRVEDLCTTSFNSVLVNLYRNGYDSVSWHADDEYELGPQPQIASLSLGATRVFKFKSRNKISETVGNKLRQINLKNGDLLVMKGDTQKHWLHCVPKCDISTPRRINLTFRRITVMS